MRSPATIILSDQLWRCQFGADPQTVGRHIELNGLDAVVAGVRPAEFRFAETPSGSADAWVPLVESPDSDVDLLVEFEPGFETGLLALVRMEAELSGLFGGAKVDLRSPNDLSRFFREGVRKRAEVQFARG